MTSEFRPHGREASMTEQAGLHRETCWGAAAQVPEVRCVGREGGADWK